MNKKAKTLLKFSAICFGVLMFSTSCSANFCTVNDQAHILYKYDSGLSYTEEGNVQYTEDGKLIPELKEGFKSELKIGNIYVRFTKKFNWFQRLMLKWVFGLNIYNI